MKKMKTERETAGDFFYSNFFNEINDNWKMKRLFAIFLYTNKVQKDNCSY